MKDYITQNKTQKKKNCKPSIKYVPLTTANNFCTVSEDVFIFRSRKPLTVIMIVDVT